MADKTLTVKILGDSSNLQQSFSTATKASKQFSVSVKESAQQTIASTARQTQRLRELQSEYELVAKTAKQGSAEQVAAAKLAENATRRLERATGVASRQAAGAGRGFGLAGSDADRFGRGLIIGTGALGRLGRAATFASSAFLGGAGFTFALRSAVDSASDLNEQMSKTRVVFGASSRDVIDFSKTTAGALGLSQRQALATASSFGALFKPIGITGKQAAEQAKQLTTLGADLASFYNTDVQDALDAIRSGLVGESEPLRRYGVLLSEARVQAEAMSESGKKTAKSLTLQEKAQARITLILRDSKVAQGDFARTSEGLANQLRILKANLDDAAASIGRRLLPGLTGAVRGVNDFFASVKSGEDVDSKAIGQRIGSGITVGLGDLTNKVADAVDEIDWGQIGKELSRGLAGAFLSIKPKEVLVGFVRLNVEIRRALLEFIIDFDKALVKAVAQAFSHAAAEAIKGILKIVGPLKRLDRFLPGSPFAGLESALQDTMVRLSTFARDGGSRVATQFVDGLARGGKNPAALQNALQAQIPKTLKPPKIDTPTGITAAQRNTFFDNMIGRREDRVQDIATLKGQVAEVTGIIATIAAEIKRVSDPTRKLTLTDELVKEQRERKSILAQIAQDTIDAAKASAQKITDALNLGLSRAEVTASFADDLKALNAIEDNLKARIRSEGRAADLMQELFDTQQKILDVQKQAAAARQFRALGLGPTGEQRVPGVAALRKELARLGTGVEGTILDTKKTTSVFSHIRRVLSGNLGKVGDEVRTAIAKILGDIDKQLKDHDTRMKATRRHFDSSAILAGLGLSPEQIREARFRLSAISPGGTVPNRRTGGAFALAGAGTTVIMHSPQFHGVTDVNALEEQLRRRNLQRARARRGPYAGRN